MNTATTNLDVTTMTDEQLATFLAEARRRKMEKAKSSKYEKFQPHYDEYRKAVTAAKVANDTKKRLLVTLKSLGFGQNVKTPATPATSNRKKGGKGAMSK